jgi:hypothetical protein
MNPIFFITNAQMNAAVPTAVLTSIPPPRLSRALQSTPVTKGATINGTSPEIVKGILSYIWGRLAAGHDAAWSGPDGGGFDPSDPEELWARTITGLMLGAIYMSPATAYSSGSDATYYTAFEGGGPFPLAVMCQQSCTIGMISRGFKHADYSIGKPPNETVGVNAGGSSGVPVWKQSGAAWLSPTPALKTLAGAIAATPAIGPGSMYEWALATPNTGPAHIAYILRAPRKSAGKALDALQFFDTGGVSGSDGTMTAARVAAPCVDGIHTFDDPWILSNVPGPNGGAGAFTGVGVLPAPSNLSGSIDMMTKAWPLGFCRLILKRTDGSVMYASPLLPMCHTDDATHNFSVARLLWSLRGIPDSVIQSEEGLIGYGSATWNVFVPRMSVTSKTLAAGRGASLASIVSSLPAGTGFPAPDKPIVLAAHMLWHLEISVDSSDTLHVKRRMQFTPEAGDASPAIPAQGGDGLPWGVATGSAVPATADIQAATPYFAP